MRITEFDSHYVFIFKNIFFTDLVIQLILQFKKLFGENRSIHSDRASLSNYGHQSC